MPDDGSTPRSSAVGWARAILGCLCGCAVAACYPVTWPADSAGPPADAPEVPADAALESGADCADRDAADARPDTDDVGAPPDDAVAMSIDVPSPVPFGAVYSRVLAGRCGSPGNCHDHEGESEAGLDLSREDHAYERLTSHDAVTAGFCTPADVQRLVVPGDPARSMFYRRVAGRTCAEQMPPAGPTLNAAELELVRRWIEDGAL